MSKPLYTLTSARFPAGVTVEIAYRIEGTRCFLCDVHQGSFYAYATEDELTTYGPDDSCDGWDIDR